MSLDVSLDFNSVMKSPVAEQVESFINQGFIVIKKDKISVKATLHNSQLILNGEDIPLDQFF
jgi:uncharacterized protein YdgA (DUF945 family)